VEFGLRSGLRSVLVLTGYGQQQREKGFAAGMEPTLIVPDLAAAAAAIIQQTEQA